MSRGIKTVWFMTKDFIMKMSAVFLSPPDVAALGEGGGFDDLWCHPGVSARGAHLSRLVPLSRQTEICDLQGFALNAALLYRLSQQN